MKPSLDDHQPIYMQIKTMIADAILEGTMPINEKVPSTNELAKFYQINPATARQGMTELVEEGILRKQRGVGMFVTDDAKHILMQQRKQHFKTNFIQPLLQEANKIEITENEIIKMIKEGENDED